MTQQNSPVFSTRRSLLVAGAAALATPMVLRAQSPAKVIRIGSPDLGTAGKPSPGSSALAPAVSMRSTQLLSLRR